MSRRIITTENLEEDAKIENNLRPQLLDDYIGQAKAKEMLNDIYPMRRESEEMHWIMSCFMARRDLERQHLPGSLPMRWA